MIFEEVRSEIIRRVRSSEVNQFLHLYIKAKNWIDILKAFKITEFYEWSFANGIIDFELFNKIPKKYREKEGFYNRKIKVRDNQNTIILLKDGDLTITQTGDFRCKIVMFGNSKLSAILGNNSMIDLEQYHNSQSQIMTNNDSFLHALVTNDSNSNIKSLGSSTIKLLQNKNSNCTVTIYEDSFLNADTSWFSKLNILVQNRNYKATQREKSEVIINRGEQYYEDGL